MNIYKGEGGGGGGGGMGQLFLPGNVKHTSTLKVHCESFVLRGRKVRDNASG